MRTTRVRVLYAFMIAGALTAGLSAQTAQSGFANMIDHIHLGVPDQARGVQWYQRHLGGQPTPEGNDRILYGTTRMIFQVTQAPKTSDRSVIEMIGFSVPDVAAAMKQLEGDGAKIAMPAMTMDGMQMGRVTDPWGTLLEVVHDPQQLGLHHITLQASDPTATLAWFADRFGGKVAQYRGKTPGINYGGVWLFATKGSPEPSAGHAIDHIGFRPANVDAAVAALKTKNVKIVTEPRPLTLPSGTTMRLAFAEGPEGIRIEMVQRDNLK